MLASFLLAQTDNAVNLQITVGQFLAAIVFVVSTMLTFVGFVVKGIGKVNELKNELIRMDERIKVLENDRTDNRDALREIRDTLNKVNIRVEVLLSKMGITKREEE